MAIKMQLIKFNRMNLEIIINRLKKIVKGKFFFEIPKNHQVVIYGDFNLSFIKQLFDTNDLFVLNSTKINIFVLIKTIFSGNNSTSNYFIKYVNYINPKILITSIDNDIYYWSFKKKIHSSIKVILLQYAWHGELADIFGLLKRNEPKEKFQIDYIFLFNENIKLKYLHYIDAKAYVVGCFKNNMVTRAPESNYLDRSITFISQYRPKQKFHPVFFYEGEHAYLRDDFYKSERKLLPILSKYCTANNLRLFVAGRENTKDEYDFMEEYIGNSNWDYLPRLNEIDSYNTILRSNVIVGIDSTLLYEAFGRYKRTAFFNERSASLKNDSYHFGWPGNFEVTGPIWTENITVNEVFRVLDFVTKCTDENWNSVYNSLSNQIMRFDENNEVLKRCINNILSE
jgi:surface carbohydrate biosynthesis protein